MFSVTMLNYLQGVYQSCIKKIEKLVDLVTAVES